MIKNEEGVLRRLETLRRRSAALGVAVKQLVAEIKEDRKNFGDVESLKKDVLKVRMRKLFDVNVRSSNLARNYERKKNLQKSVSEDKTNGEASLANAERCGDDYEFDPSTVVVSQHQPSIFPVLPLPHSKALRPIVWSVGWPMPLQRRHHIDGQFADADFKTETWVCGSSVCKNIFYPSQTRDDIGDHLDLKCWSCGYKAFSEFETDAHESKLPTEIKDYPPANGNDQELIVKAYDQEDVLHTDNSHLKNESETNSSAEKLDQEKAKQDQARDVPCDNLIAEKPGTESDTAFTKIKPLPLKCNQSYLKKKSVMMGKLDINSNFAKKRGFVEKVTVVKSQDVKPFSTRPVCTCPHPCSSAKPSKGTCPLHLAPMRNLKHAPKSTYVSLKKSSVRLSLQQSKSQTHSDASQCKSSSSSANSTSSFPGCTCPSFHSKSKDGANICKVHPNLHHLRQPTLAANFRRRRIDN